MSRDSARADFEEFVVVCSDRLLRTAYLLTGSSDAAERLLRDALARAWFSWSHLDEPPEPFVRRALVGAALRHRHGTTDGGPAGDGLWSRLQRLPRRQRAVVVLHWYDGLSLDEAADLVGCSPTAARQIAGRALARLGVDPGPQPRRTPHPQATP